MQAETPKGRRAFLFIIITVLLDMMALGMIAPVYAPLVKSFAGSTANASVVLMWFGVAFATMQFIVSPFLGMLSDRFGRRPIVLLSNFATAIDYAIMALAPNLAWLAFGRIFSGAATANMVVASAYIADTTTPEKRAAAFGMIGSAFGAGFVLGPLVGGALGQLGPHVPFWVAAGLSLANFAYGAFILPESLDIANRIKAIDWSRLNPLASLKILGSHPELAGLTWVNVLGYLAHEVLTNVWIIYGLTVFAWNSAQLGLTLTLVGVCSILASALLIQPAINRFGERRSLLIGLGVAAISYAMWGIDNGWVFLLTIPVSCLAIYNSPSQSLMTRRVAPSEQGELQGALGAIRGLTMIAGPFLFLSIFALFTGPLKSAHLPGAPWFLAGLLMVGAYFIAVRVTGREDNVVLPAVIDLATINPLE